MVAGQLPRSHDIELGVLASSFISCVTKGRTCHSSELKRKIGLIIPAHSFFLSFVSYMVVNMFPANHEVNQACGEVPSGCVGALARGRLREQLHVRCCYRYQSIESSCLLYEVLASLSYFYTELN